MGIWHKTGEKNNFEMGVDFLAMILEVANVGVVVLSKNGRILYINKVMQEKFGLTDLSLVYDFYFIDVFMMEKTSGDKIQTTADFLEIFTDEYNSKGDGSKTAEVAAVNKSTGERAPLGIRMRIVAEKIVLVFENIDKILAERGAEMEFISTASHEMRTPVAAIEGYLGLALSPATATIDERARGYLESAHDASKRLGRLFQDLLDVTKIDDNQEKMSLVPVDLKAFVKKDLEMFEPAVREKGLKLTFMGKCAIIKDCDDASHKMADKCMEVGGEDSFCEMEKRANTGDIELEQVVYVMVDEAYLHETLANLMENAIKYTSAGGVIDVQISGDSENGYLSVRDTGIGISQEDLKRIFQKFYRADNTDTREIGGTGLGLYLVKKRVERMNGRVFAESKIGVGSKFTIGIKRLSDGEYTRAVLRRENGAI